MCIVERLFSSSLVVVVSQSVPRRMNVYHFKKGTEICNYSYTNNILSVKLNRQVRWQTHRSPNPCCGGGNGVPWNWRHVGKSLSVVCSCRLPRVANFTVRLPPCQRLVVCLEESIYIHNIKDMKLLKTLLNTPTNPSGKRMWCYERIVLLSLITFE